MPVHGRAGAYVRRRFEHNLKVVVGYFGGFAVLVVILSLLFPRYFHWWLVIPIALFGPVYYRQELRRILYPSLKGARGEDAVGRLLMQLDAEGYRIINDLDIGRGNVDHVVVGRSGVFTIETKAWTGRVWIGGDRTLRCGGRDESRAVRQARAEAMAVRERMREARLDVWVEAVIALTATPLPKGRMKFGSVMVMEAKDVVEFIRSQPARLSEKQVAAAAAGALWRRGANVFRVVNPES